MNYIKSMLSSANGQLSTMRILSVFIVLNIMIVWTYMCIAQGQFVDIGADTVGLIIGVLFAKAYQRKGEESEQVL